MNLQTRLLNKAKTAMLQGTSQAWKQYPNRNTFDIFVDEVETRLRQAGKNYTHMPDVEILQRAAKEIRIPEGVRPNDYTQPHQSQLAQKLMNVSAWENKHGEQVPHSPLLKVLNGETDVFHGSKRSGIPILQYGKAVNPEARVKFGTGLYASSHFGASHYGNSVYKLRPKGYFLDTSYLMNMGIFGQDKLDATIPIEKRVQEDSMLLFKHLKKWFRSQVEKQPEKIKQLDRLMKQTKENKDIDLHRFKPLLGQSNVEGFLKREGFSGWIAQRVGAEQEASFLVWVEGAQRPVDELPGRLF